MVPVFQIGHPHRGVEQAVIPPLHQQIAFAAGIGAGKAQGGHHRFGPRIGKPHQFGGRHHRCNPVGDNQFALGRQGKDPAHLYPPPRRCIHPVIGIAKDCRAIAQPVIDISVAVDIPCPPTLAVVDIDRAVIAPIAKRRGHPQRQALHRPLKLRVGFGQVAAGRTGHGEPRVGADGITWQNSD